MSLLSRLQRSNVPDGIPIFYAYSSQLCNSLNVLEWLESAKWNFLTLLDKLDTECQREARHLGARDSTTLLTL